MRTFTVVHATGVALSTTDLEAAVALTGRGWAATTEEDRPVGVDLAGARTKADLLAYADAQRIDLSGATTRADIETRITTWHEENP